MSLIHTLPNALTATRIGLVPLLLLLAFLGLQAAFVGVLAISYATDFADGYLARRLGLVSEHGARLDSTADRLTYLALPACVLWLRPELYGAEGFAIAALSTAFVLPSLVGLIKFGRFTSYHAQLNRVAATVVALAVLCAFADGPSWLLRVAAGVYAVSALQEILISLVLPTWAADVRSLVDAVRLRAANGAGGNP